MDAFEAILARRSIRKFTKEPISDADIERILSAGISAPSGQNRQPWQFYVLTGQRIEDLAEAIEGWASTRGRRSRFRHGAKRLLPTIRSAGAVILVYNRLRLSLGLRILLRLRPDLARILDRMDTQSIGAAVENMALAATDAGLGTLWVNYVLFAAKEVGAMLRKRGKLAEPGYLMAGLLVGYPSEKPEPRPRRELSETVVWLQ